MTPHPKAQGRILGDCDHNHLEGSFFASFIHFPHWVTSVSIQNEHCKRFFEASSVSPK